MGKKVVLAEKPSVGRDIARVLNCHKKGNGYLEGQDYIVTWALGHLVTLADPEAYSEKYKTWKLEELPMLPSDLKLIVIKKTSKQFYTVKTQLTRKDVDEIVIATDAGREGELVARWILEKANVRKPVKRLWISSVTDKAIKEGFKHLKSGKAYENLYYSAIARSEADWYVGLNATRALTTKHNAQLSCGRVQTPTLSILAKREQEIKSFQPQPFYGITAETTKMKLIWQEKSSKQTRTFSKEIAEGKIKVLQQKEAVITEVNKKHKKQFAPQLYDLTGLQRDANRLFGFSAKETLSITQRLYENYKVLTYPRTDSKYLSEDIVGTLKDRLEACRIGPYTKVAASLLKKPIKATKSFVDNRKVSDHHAIIPTEQPPMMQSFSDKERKIYDLVVKRFLAVLADPAEFEEMTITAQIAGEIFIAKGKVLLNQGWKEVYDFSLEEEEEQSGPSLPSVKEGEKLSVSKLNLTQGETKPPEPFNEGSLLAAMENPARFMTDESKQLKETIGKTGGLGTVATRADIIEKLFNSFLIEKRGKGIFVTSKGKQLLDLAPEELTSPTLTAEWELQLENIAKGSLKKNAFIQQIKDYTKKVVSEIKNSEQKFKHDNVTGTKCPDCGKLMLEVKVKKGKMLVCQDRECGHRKNISKTTNARCPQCKKKLELRGEGEGQIFVCICGHREKLSAFEQRRKKEKNSKVSKGDVAKYLKNQDDGELSNPALAEALAKLKLK
ncbi:DNA topoisomerase III [Metabacillus arenae]|uniref:DNA topoisomerase 3 n=1 Tax=Metabacillus arenae TaxID=2771434 RepID=A0A926NL10_9BACI|nr:DNA topoisomerase III [Metabacillus arenae]MBD1379761.1 DNA topoisomerase III [Metabacillus arenae]